MAARHDEQYQKTKSEVIARICAKDPEANEAILEAMSLETLIVTAASLNVDVTDIDPNAKALEDTPVAKQDKRSLIRERIRQGTRNEVKPSATLSLEKLRELAAQHMVDLSDLFPGESNPPDKRAPDPPPPAPPSKMKCRVEGCKIEFHPDFEDTHLKNNHGITKDQVGSHRLRCRIHGCWRMFKDYKGRNAHVIADHPTVQTWRCDFPSCSNWLFLSEEELVNHEFDRHYDTFIERWVPQAPQGDESDMATPATAPATPEPVIVPLGGGDPIFPFQPPDTGEAHVVTVAKPEPQFDPRDLKTVVSMTEAGATQYLEDRRWTVTSLGSESSTENDGKVLSAELGEEPGQAVLIVGVQTAPATNPWDNLLDDSDPDGSGNSEETPATRLPDWLTRPNMVGDRPARIFVDDPEPTGNLDNIVGMDELKALEYLERHGWNATVQRQFSQLIPRGEVISYVRGLLREDITVYVSRGPKPQETPAPSPPTLDDRTVGRMLEQIPSRPFVLDEESDERVMETLARPRSRETDTVKEAQKPSSPPVKSATLGERIKWRLKKAWDNNTPPLDS
ncbi:MAG: PASTA domain-containing protein [Candidatus Levybacteria bacterium]|nr:PASTA domain-containing protein [Candidatus Levybacteria bacterium]